MSRTAAGTPVLVWRIADADDLAGALAALGARVRPPATGGRPDAAWGVSLDGLLVVLAAAHGPDRPVLGWAAGAPPRTMDPEDAALVRVARGGEAATHPRSSGSRPESAGSLPHVVAVGWADVDLEAAAERLGVQPAEVPRDAALGARTALAVGLPGFPLLLLEPDREGPLAASLARFGPGPCVLYLRAPLAATSLPVRPAHAGAADASTAGRPPSLRRPAAGPFGPQRLLDSRPPWGPHVAIVTAGADPDGPQPDPALDRVPSRP